MEKNMFNNAIIKKISYTKWFKTMDYYPKTISEFKLLLVYIDSLNLFNHYDLSTLANMDQMALDSIYLILRISNNIFNKFSDSCIKDVFINDIDKIFQTSDTDEFLSIQDQFYQDIYYFISNYVKTIKVNFDEIHLSTHLESFFTTLFNNNFYHPLFKNLQEKKSKIVLLSQKATNFIKYINTNLIGIYNNMKLLSNMIFYQNNYNLSYLENIVDLNEILQETEELKIYYEEKNNLVLENQNNLLAKNITINA